MPEVPQKPIPQTASRDSISAPEKSERDREIEILERKIKSMIALGEEALNRLEKVKAA